MATLKHKLSSSGGTHAVFVDADLDNIQVKSLPRIEFGNFDTTVKIEKLPRIEFGDINTHVSVEKLPKIDIEAKTDSAVNLAITKIPDVRAHLPAHYNLGISVLGIELLSFSLCGESQIITEEYIPRRVEICK